MTAEPRDVEEVRTLRQVIDSASPLPWVKHDDARMHIARRWPNNVAVIATMQDIEAGPTGVRSSANRDLIVAAVNALPALLARLAAADRENAELRNSLEACRNAGESMRTERDEARSERDDAGLLWGRHYNDAMGALETQLAAAQAQLAEFDRECYERSLEQQDALARLEAVRALAWEKVAATIDDHGIHHGYPMIPAARVLNLLGVECGRDGCPLPYEHGGPHALSAAPQPEPERAVREPARCPHGMANVSHAWGRWLDGVVGWNCMSLNPEPPASDEPTGRSD